MSLSASQTDHAVQMVDVSDKAVTIRRARARGTIWLSDSAFAVFEAGTNPKGDVGALAKVAGVMAAKKTAELLPLCHPLPLDQVRVWLEEGPSTKTVTVWCEAVAEAKTGVEMEALTGVHVALLCIYDLMKIVDPVMTIGEIYLEQKDGGRSGTWTHPRVDTEAPNTDGHRTSSPVSIDPPANVLRNLRVYVVTVSDRVHAGSNHDVSGPMATKTIEHYGGDVVGSVVLADDHASICTTLRDVAQRRVCDVIVTTGGTGFGPRDVTPEALANVCDRMAPGFGELIRAAGAHATSYAWLSRSTAGMIGPVLVIALPGSPSAVRESIDIVAPLLAHAVHVARGGTHDDAFRHSSTTS